MPGVIVQRIGPLIFLVEMNDGIDDGIVWSPTRIGTSHSQVQPDEPQEEEEVYSPSAKDTVDVAAANGRLNDPPAPRPRCRVPQPIPPRPKRGKGTGCPDWYGCVVSH